MSDCLSAQEVERYARHIVMPEIGGAGQQKLKTARVAIIGVGGLGCAAVLYLSAAGCGTIGLVDDDIVSLSNLQRQIIYPVASVGLAKTTSAKATIRQLNPHVNIEEHPIRLTDQNVDSLLRGYDMIIDGSDNAVTRYLVADYAEKHQKPLISGALGRFEGYVTTLMPYQDNNPRYSDLFPLNPAHNEKISDDAFACAQMGVIGALPGIIGSVQAMEAIKLICTIGEPLIGRLWLYDALNAHCDIMSYSRHCGD